MKSFKKPILALVSTVSILFAALGSVARAMETNGPVRDPSRLVKRGELYWAYGTGPGLPQFSLRDRVRWEARGPALPQVPAWIAQAVPNNKNNSVWAPDVIFAGGRYLLFYSYSTFGSSTSAIGVATSATLDPRSWVDEGVVIATDGKQGFNAIDPCPFEDAEGKLWLCFGSYFSGIYLVPLDASTGKRPAGDARVLPVATRPGVPGNAIEAAAVYFHEGFYYLFVNWDACCAGAKSSYNIRVGRSPKVEGPYVDKSGKSLSEGGGSLFLNATWDNGSGRDVGDQTGPGHVGILREGADFWLSTHYEWARGNRGRTTLNVQKLAWDNDGWPRAVLDEGPWKFASALASRTVAQVVGAKIEPGARLETGAYEARAGQKWRLRHEGDGFYAILSAPGGLALGTAGDAGTPGARVELAPWAAREGQKWLAQMNEDGSLTWLLKKSLTTQALDVGGCNPADGTAINIWNSNSLECQKWWLRTK